MPDSTGKFLWKYFFYCCLRTVTMDLWFFFYAPCFSLDESCSMYYPCVTRICVLLMKMKNQWHLSHLNHSLLYWFCFFCLSCLCLIFKLKKRGIKERSGKLSGGERRGCGEQWSRKEWRAFHRISQPAWMSWWKPASKPLVSAHICFFLLLCKQSDQPFETALAFSTVYLCLFISILSHTLQYFSVALGPSSRDPLLLYNNLLGTH